MPGGPGVLRLGLDAPSRSALGRDARSSSRGRAARARGVAARRSAGVRLPCSLDLPRTRAPSPDDDDAGIEDSPMTRTRPNAVGARAKHAAAQAAGEVHPVQPGTAPDSEAARKAAVRRDANDHELDEGRLSQPEGQGRLPAARGTLPRDPAPREARPVDASRGGGGSLTAGRGALRAGSRGPRGLRWSCGGRADCAAGRNVDVKRQGRRRLLRGGRWSRSPRNLHGRNPRDLRRFRGRGQDRRDRRKGRKRRRRWAEGRGRGDPAGEEPRAQYDESHDARAAQSQKQAQCTQAARRRQNWFLAV